MSDKQLTLEESILAAVQLLPQGWAVEIMVEKDFVSITCVNPDGQDEEYVKEGKESMAELVTSAAAQACYIDMKENME